MYKITMEQRLVIGLIAQHKVAKYTIDETDIPVQLARTATRRIATLRIFIVHSLVDLCREKCEQY